MTSPEARAKLVEALQLDLVGPWPEHPFARELLPENPTRWYLTGYLVPEAAPVEHRTDAEAKEAALTAFASAPGTQRSRVAKTAKNPVPYQLNPSRTRSP